MLIALKLNKIIYPLFIFLLIVCNAFSQQKTPVVLKSTITSVGSSTILLSNEDISVQQSIGQSGIIGKVNSNNTIVQQGFLNGTRFFTINNSDVKDFQERLDVVISPNPFISYIKIDFTSKTQHPVYLRIYDTNGKVIVAQEHKATESITVPMKNISIGTYMVHIVSGENKFVEKILRVE